MKDDYILPSQIRLKVIGVAHETHYSDSVTELNQSAGICQTQMLLKPIANFDFFRTYINSWKLLK